MFQCQRCGSCCRSLSQSELYSDLDRGDGICQYLDTVTNLCQIYDNRPLKCNVNKMYDQLFSQQMPRTEYYAINHAACKILQAQVKGDNYVSANVS